MQAKSFLTRREFLRRTSAAAAASAFCLHSITTAAPSQVPQGRLERLATGANICRWFRYVRRDTEEHFANYISEAEAAMMAQIGLKHVRIAIHPNVLMDQSTGAILESRAAWLEAAMRRFHRAGLLVVIDLHNEDREAELSPDWQNAFVKFWTALATRLKGFDPDLTVFEIINEPVFAGREEEWNVLNARLTAAIRQSAPQHTIMTTGAGWGGIDGLKRLTPLPDKNIVYSFHCYDPFPFTHQGATWAGEDVKPLRGVPYPSSPETVAPLLAALDDKPGSRRMVERYGNERWNKARLAARFKEGIEWGARQGVALYCGEFGVFPVHSDPEHRANWFRDFGQVLAEHRIGWAVWGWDEGFGLNRRYVDGKPQVDQIVVKSLGLRSI
ncbi:MAG: cellulase family glycosylhydrolase [Phycisphaerae bacterium]|nr:cellulase family glycosylhydrolase [Phycisphaerae bacterium]